MVDLYGYDNDKKEYIDSLADTLSKTNPSDVKIAKYTVIKRKVYKKLIYDKLQWVKDIFDNEYLGKLIGYFIGYVLFFVCFIPVAFISLFQLKSYIKKIQNDIDNRPDYIKNWVHLHLVKKI